MAIDTKPTAQDAAEVKEAAATAQDAATQASGGAASKSARQAAASEARLAKEKGTSAPRPDAGTRAERKWIKKERKKLRRELKEKGITSRTDFETIAHDLGLDLDKRHAWLLWFWLWWGRLLSSLGLKALLAAAAALLALLFFMSYLSETAGSFTINLTSDMLYAGFTLSETEDFENPSVRLIAEEITNVTNIDIQEIPDDVTEIDGMQNDRDYFAYTFYIRNEGEEAADYLYRLNMLSDTMNVSDAVWVMLFEEDYQVVYAKESADGNAEEIYGYRVAPFGDVAYDYSSQYYEEDGRYGLVATSFTTDNTIVEGIVENIAPGEYKKYTVVIWVEGEDPECTNDIFGGYAELSMDFELIDDDSGIDFFSGVYRTEYDI